LTKHQSKKRRMAFFALVWYIQGNFKTCTMKAQKFSKDRKVIGSYEDLADVIKGYRVQGKTIALTMGSFDMIHDGHVKYIELAKQNADILILGVDDDAVIKKAKGEDRPFDDLSTRLTILAALSAVDHILVRKEEDSISKLCEVVRPDFLVISTSSNSTKGYDVNKTEEKESFEGMMDRMYIKTDIAKQLIVLDPQSSNSTTSKMRKLKSEGGKELAEKIGKVIDEHLNSL